jgi:adenylate cyclase
MLFLGLLLAIRFWDPAPIEILRLKTLDIYQVLKPRAATVQPVVIVDIDEQSLATHGQWPWPRTLLADLTSKLFVAGVATVGFDIVFAEPDRLSPGRMAESIPNLSPQAKTALRNTPDNDLVFRETLRRHPTVLGRFLRTHQQGGHAKGLKSASIAKLGGDPMPFLPQFDGALANLPVLEAVASGIGMLVPSQEHDNIIRRVPAMVRIGETIQPTLSLEVLRVATGQKTYVVKTDEAGISSVVIAGNEIPTDRQGRIWVHYTPSRSALYISAADILSGKAGAAILNGRLALVGTSALGLQDLRATPLDSAMPGVEVHAQLLETILSGSLLERPNFSVGAELSALAIIGLLVIFLIPRVGALLTLGAGGAVALILTGGAWWLFSEHRLLIDVSYPLLASFAVFAMLSFMNYVREQSDRRQIRSAFSRYLAPEMVNRLNDNPETLRLGGEMREMTLLFSDVQGFTGIAENYDAVGLTKLINTILTPLTDEVLRTGGTVDKYMGDALMAFWNAPLDDPDHAANACRSALALRAQIGPLNDRIEQMAISADHEFVPVNVGVGINTGECCVGNMGSDQRFDYSVLGDAVNLASRFEGQTRTYGVGILAGEKTVALAQEFAFLELDLITVKGKTIPERIFTLVGDGEFRDTAAFGKLSEVHTEMLAAYRRLDLDRAEVLLAETRTAATDAGLDLSALYDLYRDRLSDYRIAPPPGDWGGVFVATTKG